MPKIYKFKNLDSAQATITELAKSLGYDIDEAQAEDEEKDEEEAGK